MSKQTSPLVKVFPLLAAICFVLSGLSIPPHTEAISNSIVISEFRTRGPNGANDEFVEIYNLSSSPVNIGGWQLNGSNAQGSVSTRAIVSSGTTLNSGCHYLFTNPNPSGGPYGGSVPGNQTFSPGITDDGGIAITTAGGTIVDQVGMSSGSAFKEGSPLAPRTANTSTSYERRPGGIQGHVDTDNNSSDFSFSGSSPRNAGSGCLAVGGGTPTNPTGIGNASPNKLSVGAQSVLTVSISPGSNPISTGIVVIGDLTSIGGSIAQGFFNDGTNGDAVAGDSIFSYQATVGIGIADGQKNLPVLIRDSQQRSSNASIGLTIESSGTGQCGVERWSIKTGTDPDAAMIDLSTPVPTTITMMRDWTAPNMIPASTRVTPHETTQYSVIGTMTLFKLEDDSDYHIVIQDNTGNTIITEIPCPCCTSQSSPFASMIAAARMEFDSRFNADSSFQTVSVPVVVKGIGFFDFLHGATGAAPNGIELHPVLDIAFIDSTTKPRIISATVDGKRLLIKGFNFDNGAVILVNDEEQVTKKDGENPGLSLIGKKAGKKLPLNVPVILRIRNPDGVTSDDFTFTKT